MHDESFMKKKGKTIWKTTIQRFQKEITLKKIISELLACKEIAYEVAKNCEDALNLFS